MRLHSWVDPAHDAATLAETVDRRHQRGAMWTADSVKFMLDGVIDTGTAWLEEPDTLGAGTTRCGPTSRDSGARSGSSTTPGFRIATHAIGDRAVREVLDAYAALPGRGPHRIEHVEAAPPATVARFAREGVTASMQPIHLRWLTPS